MRARNERLIVVGVIPSTFWAGCRAWSHPWGQSRQFWQCTFPMPRWRILFCSVGGLAPVIYLNQPALFGVDAGTVCSGVIYFRSQLDAMNSSLVLHHVLPRLERAFVVHWEMTQLIPGRLTKQPRWPVATDENVISAIISLWPFFCVMSSTPLSEERQDVRFSAPRAGLHPESFGLETWTSVWICFGLGKRREAAIYRNGRLGEYIGGLHEEIFDQLHHNRYIRRSS